MKINDPTSSGVSANKVNDQSSIAQAGRGGRNGAASGGLNGDRVQLSSLTSMVRTLSSDGPERSSLVDRLAFQVQSGQYAVNSMELSSSIIDSALKGF